jgi:outer membrane protein assembly complex protein YaeT
VHCHNRNFRKPSAYFPRRWARHCGPAPLGGRAAQTLIIFTLLLGSCTKQGRAQDAPDLSGRAVTSLQLQCDCNLKLQNFPGAVTQQSGQPLDPAKISESLKRLYATGRFAELRADGTPQGDGVAITFVARAQYFIGIMTAEGNPGPIEARALVTASRLRLGQSLSEEDLNSAHKRISDLLIANAYYQSVVTHKIERDPNTLEANVAFTIKAGPPARVSSVQFIDDSGFPPERLMKVSGWHPRLYLTATRVERGLYRLRQFYLAHGRIQANISVKQRVYDAKTNTEKLVVKAQGGPLLRVRVQGASISSAQLQNLLPLYHDGVADDQALALSAKLLEGYFQQKGYFFAVVKTSRVPRKDPQPHTEILFSVELGQHGTFAGFGVKGNRAIPTSELQSAISPPDQGLLPQSPTFSQDLMDQKVATLLSLYQSRGYLDARITPAINDNFGNVPGRRYVSLVINEGSSTTVHTLTLQGVDAATESKIWPSLVSKPTRPYSVEGAHADRDSILDYLGDHGYTHAEANWRTTPAKIAHQVDLEFQIVPGAQDHVKRIVILGDEHVRTSLVKRELVIHEGEPVSQSAIQDSQRGLYDLGIFNQVQITPQEQPDSDTEQTMLVGLEEARRWSLGYGGGLEVQRLGSNTPEGTFKASPRGSLSLSRLDVGGRGQTFSMSGRLSYIDTGADAGYLVPRLLNRDDLDLRFKVLTDLSREVLTFTENLQQASLSVEKHLHGSALLIGRYSFERIQALDISNRVSPAEAALYSQPAIVGMTEGTFLNDRRDDPLDATRGSYTLINSGVAWTGFGSQSDFFRFNGKNSTYYTLNSHLIFARLTQFGVVSHFGGLYNVTVPASNGEPAQVIETNEIPITERFFMGGSQSMRGFSINQAGPRDPVTGYPIGGNALFLNSLELRTFFAQRRLGLVLFEDAGNVYTSIREMRLLKVTQSSPGDFDYTSHAVGLGFRFKTPVGPLSFDLGYNLNPPRYNVVTVVNGVSNTEVQRLSNFQFFLSFGQSF